MDSKILIVLALVLIAIGVGGYFFFNRPSACQNNVCNEKCSCPVGQFCSAKTQTCAKPECGNNVCELYENPKNCCKDCGCYNGNEICNEQNNCETFVSKLTDEQVEGKIREYYRLKGKENEIVKISGFEVVTFDNKPARSAVIESTNEHARGGILLENNTLVIMEKTSVVDVWNP